MVYEDDSADGSVPRRGKNSLPFDFVEEIHSPVDLPNDLRTNTASGCASFFFTSSINYIQIQLYLSDNHLIGSLLFGTFAWRK